MRQYIESLSTKALMIIMLVLGGIISLGVNSTWQSFRWHHLRIDKFQYEVIDYRYDKGTNEIILQLENK